MRNGRLQVGLHMVSVLPVNVRTWLIVRSRQRADPASSAAAGRAELLNFCPLYTSGAERAGLGRTARFNTLLEHYEQPLSQHFNRLDRHLVTK